MRQLCNVSFSLQAESMDKKEFERFVRELPLEPGQKRSQGARALMSLMGGGGPARRRDRPSANTPKRDPRRG